MTHAILLLFTLITYLGATPSLAQTYTPEDIAQLERLHREQVLNAVLQTLGTDARRVGRVEKPQLRKFVVELHGNDIRDRVQKALTEEACPYSNWGGACAQITFDEKTFLFQLRVEVQRIISKFNNQKSGTFDPTRSASIGADQILELLDELLSTPAPLTVRDVLAMGGFREPNEVAVPKPPTPVGEPIFLGALANVRIRRSFLDRQTISLPAGLAYSNIGSSDDARREDAESPHKKLAKASSYSVRGALEWSPQLLRTEGRFGDATVWKYTLKDLLVYEADLSSDSSDNRDKIVHRLGTRWVAGKVTNSVSWFSGVLIDSTLDYMTDRRYDAKDYGLTVNLTPNMYPIGVGLPLLVRDNPNVLFRWRPYVSLNYADINDASASPTFANRKDYLNLLFKVSGEIKFWNRFVLTAEVTQTRELRNAEQDHTHFLTNGQLRLSEEGSLSLNLSYERGELPPAFPDRDRFGVELGVKF